MNQSINESEGVREVERLFSTNGRSSESTQWNSWAVSKKRREEKRKDEMMHTV